MLLPIAPRIQCYLLLHLLISQDQTDCPPQSARFSKILSVGVQHFPACFRKKQSAEQQEAVSYDSEDSDGLRERHACRQKTDQTGKEGTDPSAEVVSEA